MSLSLMTTGAALLSLQVPCGGSVRQVLLPVQPDTYDRQSVYLNAIVGRFANRIAGSEIQRDGKYWHLSANQGAHCLHGGMCGFDRREWEVISKETDQVELCLFSPDGEQGFPGDCSVIVKYKLDQTDLLIDISATVSQPCPVNLTSHAYFNLNGNASDVRKHLLQVNATRYLPIDPQGIPLSDGPDFLPSSLDFSALKMIAEQWLQHPQQVIAKGIDHCYLLSENSEVIVARLISEDQQLAMEMFTNQPGLQVYTGNYLAGTPDSTGGTFHDHDAICLEAQQLPDSPNRPELGNSWLLPGETYHHQTRYRFITQ